MRTRHSGRLIALLACTVWAAAVMLVTPAAQPASSPLPQEHKRMTTHGSAFQSNQLYVEGGSEERAKAYYQKKVSPQLHFMTEETILSSTLRDLLTYFGYTDISATDLHRLSSETLMAKAGAGEILAMRYFAPKITEVSDKPVSVPQGGFGWRKLVRFKTRPGSSADTHDMDSLLVLQNIFEPTAIKNPFDPTRNVALFNQVIVVRRGTTFGDDKLPLYFMAYGPFVKVQVAELSTGESRDLPIPEFDDDGNFVEAGRLISHLRATFDEKDRDPETNLGPNDYFVPDSCVACHGAFPKQAKVNFLDTDHWIDRVTPKYDLSEAKFQEEDFTLMAKSPHRVLYDAKGQDEDSPEHKRAFAVIRQFNEEVAAQNSRVSASSFQLNAVKRWLELHPDTSDGHKHVAPAYRGIGTPTWDPANESHRKLLYYLNRYCYRCHSSVRYNVFDLKAVKARLGNPVMPPTESTKIPARVLNLADERRWMPQDRIFPGLEGTIGQPLGTPAGDLKEFLDLLVKLQ